MNIYQVGGSVRDMFLGVDSNDIDYVVVGATVEEFKLQYQDAIQVGKSFPVFLAKNKDGIKCEYAFARKERKTGKGHKGFEVEFSPEVTLEDDLMRRDLTINAIALSEDGDIIDPFNGLYHLEIKTLQHVSEAFIDDPLRVYRLCRFFSTLLGFTVSLVTLQYFHFLRNQLNELSAERVWKEFEKALKSSAPERFISLLKVTNCVDIHFKEFGNKQNLRSKQVDSVLSFCELVEDFTLEEINNLCDRLKVPNIYRKSALITINNLTISKNLQRHSDDVVLEVLESTKKFPLGQDTFFKLLGDNNTNKGFYFGVKECLNVNLPDDKKNKGIETAKFVRELKLQKLKNLRYQIKHNLF